MAVWLDESSFVREVEENPESIFVIQYCTDWCTNCALVTPILDELEETYKDNENVYFAYVDVDSELELAEKHNIASIPSTCIYRGETVLERIVGAHSKDVYKNAIQKSLLDDDRELNIDEDAKTCETDID